ncbi:hypothetical protein GCM10010383_28290 [Streptomyces lomondensis]|uniref:Uncharacterized protein n=1 Tax=Streptomyces lomondensis TaxID=68229 RepID=A0ABQ2X386_9ACTN|nr:hypothetical protein GCM10010383_28290 [Streptomyces lomondensis]
MGERGGSGGRRLHGWKPVAAGVLLLLPLTAGQAAADSGRSDVRLVYCLADEHRGELRDAALRIGVVRRPQGPAGGADAVEVPGPKGGVRSLDEWAEKHRGDFERVCDAVMAAAGDPPGATADKGGGGLGGYLDGVLLLATGAVLTLVGQMTERRSAERRTYGRQLTAAVREFRRIAWLYLTAYEQDPETDHSEALRAREALSGLLALVPGPAPRRAAARHLADSLPLADPLPRSRDGRLLQPHERKNEADAVRTTVDRQTRDVADLRRPAPVWWLRGSRHGGRPPSAGGQHG